MTGLKGMCQIKLRTGEPLGQPGARSLTCGILLNVRCLHVSSVVIEASGLFLRTQAPGVSWLAQGVLLFERLGVWSPHQGHVHLPELK